MAVDVGLVVVVVVVVVAVPFFFNFCFIRYNLEVDDNGVQNGV